MGFPTGISGADLVWRGEVQAMKFGMRFVRAAAGCEAGTARRRPVLRNLRQRPARVRRASIAQMFLVAATMFAGVGLWGYAPGRDLARWSTFLLIGVVATSLINVFVGSSAIQTIASLIGVVVFTGLTGRDAQRAKSDYLTYAGTEHRKGRGYERAQPCL